MATQLQQARKQFSDILGYKAIHKINFTFDGIVVTPAFYARIARAILRDKVHIEIDKEPDPGVAAYYRPSANTIFVPYLPYGVYPKEKVTIVHECTHAILDMNKIRTTNLKNEVVGHIASAIFRVASDFTFSTISKIHPVAVAVAEDMLATGRRSMKVGDPDIAILATVILNDPVYLSARDYIEDEFKLNGIKGA